MGKRSPLDKSAEHAPGPGRTNRRFPANRQSPAACRRPPTGTGATMRRRDRRPRGCPGVRHDRHGAEILHRADELLALGNATAQAVFFRQQEVPQPQRGGRIVHPQFQQPHVAILDVPPQRSAVVRLAVGRGASQHSERTAWSHCGKGNSFGGMVVSLVASPKMPRFAPARGLARRVVGADVDFQHRHRTPLFQAVQFGVPEVAPQRIGGR